MFYLNEGSDFKIKINVQTWASLDLRLHQRRENCSNWVLSRAVNDLVVTGDNKTQLSLRNTFSYNRLHGLAFVFLPSRELERSHEHRINGHECKDFTYLHSNFNIIILFRK